MKTKSRLLKTLPALLIALLAIFAITPVQAQDADKVTVENYVRAESDLQMKLWIQKLDNFGKFYHFRDPYKEKRVTVRGNQDTFYSFGVWDLTSPITVTLPETGGRYQTLMLISQDHSISSFYGPRTGTLTEEKMGSRYVFMVIRTFADPNDPADIKIAHALQDAVKVEQANIGTFEVPNWNTEEVEEMRETINVIATTIKDSGKLFGRKEALDPVYHMMGTALGWGGLPAEAATYAPVVPEKNDGKTAYTLTVTDVPVYAFWSVTLYDADGYMPDNKYDAHSFNDITAKKAKDGSITIHFGGDPNADNFLPIVPGWNYLIRMYKPGPEILDGSWTFPEPVIVD